MDIIIEVGDEHVQSQIREELEYLLGIAEAIDPPLNINRIIVPADFQAKINEIQGGDEFKVKRGIEETGVTVLAKNIEDGESVSIILSPFLYVSSIDTMFRCFILAHELFHVFNKRTYPPVPKDSFAQENYLGTLYILFDEYTADRFAFMITEKTFTTPTKSWELCNGSGFLGYLEATSDPRYYDHIRSEIDKFRYHADVQLYWNSIIENVNVLAISTVHGFARYHEHYEKYRDTPLPKNNFINEKTLVLMDYFKRKYEDYNIDLNDGIDLIANYLTNFGVRFEDRGEGGYIYVLDI